MGARHRSAGLLDGRASVETNFTQRREDAKGVGGQRDGALATARRAGSSMDGASVETWFHAEAQRRRGGWAGRPSGWRFGAGPKRTVMRSFGGDAAMGCGLRWRPCEKIEAAGRARRLDFCVLSARAPKKRSRQASGEGRARRTQRALLFRWRPRRDRELSSTGAWRLTEIVERLTFCQFFRRSREELSSRTRRLTRDSPESVLRETPHAERCGSSISRRVPARNVTVRLAR